MDFNNNSVRLYSSQTTAVTDLILKDGVYFVKMEYIRRKYGEVASVFINAYEWYVDAAQRIVPKPIEAESAVWAFESMMSLERHGDCHILELEVPIEEVIFFDMADFSKILNMTYVGVTKEQENDYKTRLFENGAKHASDVVTTQFYPLFKRELYGSWKNLFRHDMDIKTGKLNPSFSVQAGLWKIDKQWVRNIN